MNEDTKMNKHQCRVSLVQVQEEHEQNEVDRMKKGADSIGKMMHMWKSSWWFVMRKIQMVELGWQ